jgi:HK97 family phage major capsid protein
MNIAELIAKFVKEGFASLTSDEKELLKANVSLMSVSQRKDFESDSADAEAEDEGADEDGADEGDDEEDADEKAMRDLVAKSVNDEIGEKVDNIASQLVSKFFDKAASQRKKAIDTGKKTVDANRESTREFIKALVAKDKEYLKKHVDTGTSGAGGGYLVPDELLKEVLRIAEKQYGFARRNFRYLPFSGPGNSRKIPTLSASVSVYWTDEGVAKTSSQPTFGLVTQTLKKLATIVPLTEEILEDSAINLTELVAELFAEAVAKEEDVQFLTGSGSPWTGLLNNTSVNTKTMATGDTAHTDITADYLLDMIDETPSGALPGSKFLLHRKVLSVVRKLKDSNGAPIFQRAGDGIPATIWDFPFETSDAMPSTAAANTPFVLFGNFRVGAVFGDKQEIRTKLLTEATIGEVSSGTINLAEQDMIALRMVERVGYVAAVPTAITRLKTATT